MKILLDTNVLFSGLGFRGGVGLLLEELVRQRQVIVSSDYILAELNEKIKLKFSPGQREKALTLLAFIIERAPFEIKSRESYSKNLGRAAYMVPPQDTPIMAAAILPDVDYFVTGDNHFLKNKKIRRPLKDKIKSPSEMFGMLTENS